jgi:hypothetical protein
MTGLLLYPTYADESFHNPASLLKGLQAAHFCKYFAMIGIQQALLFEALQLIFMDLIFFTATKLAHQAAHGNNKSNVT